MNKKTKNLNKRLNDNFIKSQVVVPYSIASDSFYKHIDELVLADGKTIKATLGPVDMSVYPYNGVTTAVVLDNRIDLIATKHYGKASMWRAVAYLNSIADPLSLKPNTVLMIPNKDALKQFPNPLS